MPKTYRVTVTGGFNAKQRVRNGVTVDKTYGYTGELTPDQLKAIEADELLHVAEHKPEQDESDTGVDDAKTEASRIIADAEAKAKEVVEAAEEASTKVADQAEADAKKVTDQATTDAAATRKAAEEAAKTQPKQPAQGNGNK